MKNTIVKFKLVFLAAIAAALVFPSCRKEWRPGTPLPKGEVKIGVIHITDPFNESSGYSYAHQKGIEEMKLNLGLADSQFFYRCNVDDVDPLHAESALREFLAQGANIVLATSWGYMDVCEKLAKEFPGVVFAHATGYKYNDSNFTNYFGRVYQARYLSGIVAGLKTRTGKIGFVAAWGKENSEVTGGIDAFAMGVERANPQARVYVRVTHSWYDPMGEAAAARSLIAAGCDIIAQHCDTANPQMEAEKANVWGIGYNTDMSVDAPAAVLTSVIWRWGAYYTSLVQSIIDGTFVSTPWFGSLNDGIVDISPLSKTTAWAAEELRILESERYRIESGAFDVFSGVIETNNGAYIGSEGGNLGDDEIRNGINWYYRTVAEM